MVDGFEANVASDLIARGKARTATTEERDAFLAPGDDPQASRKIPSGGTTGQALVKATDTNFDVEWGDAGAGSSVLTGDATSATLATEQIEIDTLYAEVGDTGFNGTGTRMIVDDASRTVSLDAANGVIVNGSPGQLKAIRLTYQDFAAEVGAFQEGQVALDFGITVTADQALIIYAAGFVVNEQMAGPGFVGPGSIYGAFTDSEATDIVPVATLKNSAGEQSQSGTMPRPFAYPKGLQPTFHCTFVGDANADALTAGSLDFWIDYKVLNLDLI